MGQAKRRGTFEQRKQEAIERNNKAYAAKMLEIHNIRTELQNNREDITPVLIRRPNKGAIILAIAAALSATTGAQFHMPSKEKDKEDGQTED